MQPTALVTEDYDAVEAGEYEVIADDLTGQVKAALGGPVGRSNRSSEIRELLSPPWKNERRHIRAHTPEPTAEKGGSHATHLPARRTA